MAFNACAIKWVFRVGVDGIGIVDEQHAWRRSNGNSHKHRLKPAAGRPHRYLRGAQSDFGEAGIRSRSTGGQDSGKLAIVYQVVRAHGLDGYGMLSS